MSDETPTTSTSASASPSTSTSTSTEESPVRRRGVPLGGHAGIVALTAGVLALAVVIVLVVAAIRHGGGGSSAEPADPTAHLTYPSRAQAFVAGATSDVASITSYSYKTLQSDLYNGEAVSTGAFRARYRAALTGSLGATARRVHRTQTFELAAAGIGQMAADGREAHVLVFGTQSVQDDTTGGRTDDSLVTLDVTVRRAGSNYLVSGLEIAGDAGLPPGTAGLSAAAETARQEVASLLTTRRAQAAADSRAAQALAVGPFRTQLVRQAPAIVKAVRDGRYNLIGVVTAVAVQSADGNSVTMLVAATGQKTTAAGQSSVVTDGRYRVTVVRIDGRWLVSAVAPIAVA